LFVSPRTLYLLQNLVTSDVTDPRRYAIQFYDYGQYEIVTEEDEEDYALFLSVSNQAQLEVIDMVPFAIEDALIESVDQSISSPADYNLSGSEVPEGEVWLLQSMAAYFTGTCTGYIALRARGPDSEVLFLEWNTSPVVSIPTTWAGSLILPAGSKAEARFKSVGAGSFLNMTANYAKLLR
jgi:hypothetical protein